MEANEMKGCKKMWKRRRRHGRHGGRHGGPGGPMRHFFRMMMGGRRHCGPFRGHHGGRRHGGRRHGHGGPRRHGHGKFWRKHGQRQEMSYEDQLQEAIKRSLGLEDKKSEEVTIENEGMCEEMTEDKKVNRNMTSESSDGTSSDTSDSNSSDSDSNDQPPVPEMPNLEHIAQVAQTILGGQG